MKPTVHDIASHAGVSIVMPAYNAAAFIERSVASVRAQTFRDWQLLIVDDCSTDDTWQLIERYAADDARIRPLRQPHDHQSRENS